MADKLRRALRDMLGLKEGDPRPSRLMDLRKVFDQFDDDESKTVDRDEFGENLRRLGVDIPREDMKLLLDRLDTDGDRQISFAEFIEFVEPERVRVGCDCGACAGFGVACMFVGRWTVAYSCVVGCVSAGVEEGARAPWAFGGHDA